jgi:AraC-like DNA-binding protein
LSDPEGWLTPEEFARFWRAHVETTNDEFFGQDLRGMPGGSFTLLCHAVLSAPTLERAILRMLRYFRILLADFDAELVREGHSAEIILLERGPARPPFSYATFLVLLLGVACWLIDRRIPLLEVEFRSSCPVGREHYRRLFCNEMAFDRPQTRICFDAEFLSIRPLRSEAQMKRFLRDSPESLLTQYRSRDSISARIWLELRRTPPEDWPGFDELSARLYTTASTLRRRLEAEGISYQRIKDGVRRERAINQLRQNKKSNAEIAEELGFGDPSTFYRAFRKWTGATPNTFRRPLHAAG